MSKIEEILSSLAKSLPADQQKEIANVVEAALADIKSDLDKEYEVKLHEAYESLSDELKGAEKTAETGYGEAFGIIADLRNRLEMQRNEFEKALEEGYEEAFQMLQTEKAEKEKLEGELYEQYDKKLAEMREFFIDKLDEFLQVKGKEIYEQARKDVVNDPNWAAHRVVLNKVVETVSDYIGDEEYALATSARLEKAEKEASEVKSQLKIIEARNIKLSAHNHKLEEAVRQNADLIKEHTNAAAKADKNERAESSKKVEGRGKIVTENTEVIAEPGKNKDKATNGAGDSTPISEGTDWSQMRALAGVPVSTPDKK